MNILFAESPTIDSSDPSQVIVTSGQSAKLICRAKGIPPPRIAWTFRGQPVMETNMMYDFSMLLNYYLL